ncbi:MAG: hypothetical protein ACK5RL_06585 [Acidimicrobiales bacterium]
MKAYTSRDRFDEERGFVGVHEEMGRARLDADANEQVLLSLTDTRRRSADLADGSPDDGFLITDTFVVDAITSTAGWAATGLEPGDPRVILPELRLERRDRETLPHVLRTRGHIAVQRVLPQPIDLRHVPEPGRHAPPGATWEAAALVVRIRIDRRANDDEIVDTRLVVRDDDGAWHPVAPVGASADGEIIEVALADLRPILDRGDLTVLTGWGVTGLPPRAETNLDTLLARPADLGTDLIVRGGGGTPATAGRIYAAGRRASATTDWRYSTQPHLPSPRPVPAPDPGQTRHHLFVADIVDREVHGWEDPFIVEPALDGDPTTFRRQQVVQVRAVPVDLAGDPSLRPPLPDLATPTGTGRLSSAIADGVLPDRTPPEEPDRCRERCLSTEQISVGEGYIGNVNANVRVEVIGVAGEADPAVAWSRDNASLAARLTNDLPADAVILTVDRFDASRVRAGDIVTLEDRASRLDPGDERHHPMVRRLRAVDTATGRLELEPAGHQLAPAGGGLPAGGPAGRALLVSEGAAVRRWDGADWLVTGERYRLVDNITFAFSGQGFRPADHWTFTARVVDPDARSQGLVERRDEASPDGPHHVRVPLATLSETRNPVTGAVTRVIVDRRRRFLPLAEVRDRLVELGRRHLAPGAFTVVVGDGVRTFGDIDQNLGEGVTGDEAIHAALAELRGAGGTVYLRAGVYTLEHPVVLQGLSGVRILGDGPATRLQIRSAGGAFVLDDCGWVRNDDPHHKRGVSIELMDLVEEGEAAQPVGGDRDGLDGVQVGTIVPLDDGGGALRPGDLTPPGGGLAALLDTLRDRVAGLTIRSGRASASVVATVLELRRLQRTRPGRPLAEVAPDQLETLRRLPHGVISVGDSSGVELRRLGVESTVRAVPVGTIGAGVLLTGTLHDVVVDGCRIVAPAGVVATALAGSLAAEALVLRPRSGLSVRSLRIEANDIGPGPGAGPGGSAAPAGGPGGSVGVRVADGDVQGVGIVGNTLVGFDDGVVVEDGAEVRFGEPVHRTVVRENRVEGIAGIGIDIRGDGVDVGDNEVRLAPSARPRRIGIRLAGSNNRVAGGTVSLPATDPGAGPLDLEAGVVVGQGSEGGGPARPVSDVTVADLHITGTGPATVGHGLVVAGPAPVDGVRVTRCRIHSVGGCGVRAMGHGAPIGAVQIDDCEIGDVAGNDLRWSSEVTAAAAALVPTATGNSTGLLLRSLLDADQGRIAEAIDGVLRWTEAATLRGGVVLSLVDEATVADNRIAGVGGQHLVTQIAGTGIHLAGVAVVGGTRHNVDGNHISGVRSPIRRSAPPIRPPIILPGLLEALGRLGSVSLSPGADLHGAIVGIRSLVHQYAVADAGPRQQLGYRIYGAMEAVHDGLSTRGAQAARLAVTLADAIEVMRSAQGLEGHTDAAIQVRGIVAQAAELTAPDPATAEAWGYAARVDRSIGGDPATVAEVAQDIVDAAPRLMTGLGLGIDLAVVANRVVAADPARRLAEAQTLAGELGRVAGARRRAGTVGVGGRLAGRQSTLLSTVLANVERQLPAAPARDVNRALVHELSQGIDALTDSLAPASNELAQSVRTAYERLRRGDGAPPAADVEALRTALDKTRRFLVRPEVGPEVDDADAEAEAEVADGQLVMLTTDWIDRRLASLASADVAAETRSLGLLRNSARQLGRLVGDHSELQAAAREVNDALELAEADPGERATHTQRAARALLDLRTTQARLVAAGAPLVPVVADDETDERLATLAHLLTDLSRDTGREDRVAAASAIGADLRRVVTDGVELPAGERRALLDELDGIEGPLSAAGSGIDRLRALNRTATVLARVADAAADQRATSEAEAVSVLTATLQRAVSPTGSPRERLAAAQAYVGAAADAISPATASGLLAAADPASLLARLDVELGSLTGVVATPARPVLPPEVVDPVPADGILAAQVAGDLAVVANSIEGGGRGIVIGGPTLNPMAPLDVVTAGGALDIGVRRNRIRGAVVTGIDVDVDRDARVAVEHNDVEACGGAALVDDGPAPGRATVAVRGRGQATVDHNRLEGNGSSTHAGLIHGIAVRLDGDVAIAGNRIRHQGGQHGGAGLVVTVGAIPADGADGDRSWDFDRLCTTPFLSVDPPPRPRQPVVPTLPTFPTVPNRPVTPIGPAYTSSVLAASLGHRLLAHQPVTSLSPDTSAAVLVAGQPPAVTSLVSPPDLLATPNMADALAVDWLRPRPAPQPRPGPTVVPGLDLGPLLDFLDRFPRPPVPLPPLRIDRSLQVGGNDIVSRGPALLTLGNRVVRLRVSVGANTLVSTGTAGAVYLRDIDAGVVAGNRIECPLAVTVLLLRVAAAPVSVSGNVLTGRQPPAVPRPSVPVRPDLGISPIRPKVTLGVDLGEELGGQLSVALDPERVLGALREERESTTARAAAAASAAFTTFAQTNRIATSPRAAAVLDVATQIGILDVDLSALSVSYDLKNLPPVVVRDRTESDTLAVEVSRLTADFAKILDAGNISATTKLYGLAKSSGLPDTGAKALVQQHLLRNHDDETAALRSGLGALTGVEVPAATVPTGRLGLPVLESLLGPILDDVDLTPIDPGGAAGNPFPGPLRPVRPGATIPINPIGPVGPVGPVTPRPPSTPLPRPPVPGRHSLVVLGGAQVAVTGNASTAGSYVEPDSR